MDYSHREGHNIPTQTQKRDYTNKKANINESIHCTRRCRSEHKQKITPHMSESSSVFVSVCVCAYTYLFGLTALSICSAGIITDFPNDVIKKYEHAVAPWPHAHVSELIPYRSRVLARTHAQKSRGRRAPTNTHTHTHQPSYVVVPCNLRASVRVDPMYSGCAH